MRSSAETNERRPLLSIGVPTYNRSRFLEGLITSVFAEAERHGLEDQVEMVVSDNASADGTGEMVARLQARTRMRIRYHRNDANLGPVRNCMNTLRMAHGEYWMFSGDDEVMVEGALPAILGSLQAHPGVPAFVFGDDADAPGKARAAERLTLPQVAREYFYYLGNAGLSAVRTDLARAEFARWGAERFTTWWPQTQLAFVAMAADGREHPAVRAYVPTLTSPHHAQNTVYTSWYIWETTLHCLYQIALDLRPQIGEAAFRGACANLFRGARFRSTARGVFLYTTLFDLPEEVAETRASAWKSLRTATGETIAPLLGMWLITATPRPLKALALRGGVWARWGWGAREELRRLQARRDEHARRRAGAQQGGTGLYRPDDI